MEDIFYAWLSGLRWVNSAKPAFGEVTKLCNSELFFAFYREMNKLLHHHLTFVEF